jgi:hypothetical protein
LGARKRDQNDDDDDQKTSSTEREHVLEDKLEAEQHDPQLQACSRGKCETWQSAFGDPACVRQEEAEHQRSDHRRHPRYEPMQAEGDNGSTACEEKSREDALRSHARNGDCDQEPSIDLNDQVDQYARACGQP